MNSKEKEIKMEQIKKINVTTEDVDIFTMSILIVMLSFFIMLGLVELFLK